MPRFIHFERLSNREDTVVINTSQIKVVRQDSKNEEITCVELQGRPKIYIDHPYSEVEAVILADEDHDFVAAQIKPYSKRGNPMKALFNVHRISTLRISKGVTYIGFPWGKYLVEEDFETIESRIEDVAGEVTTIEAAASGDDSDD